MPVTASGEAKASFYIVGPKNSKDALNKWSKSFDKRPHRRRTRAVQSYSPGCANVPTRVHNPNGISIGSAVLAGFTIRYSSVRKFITRTCSQALCMNRKRDHSRQTRRTMHATPSVTIGRIHVRSTAMRPKMDGQSACHPLYVAALSPHHLYLAHGARSMHVSHTNNTGNCW